MSSDKPDFLTVEQLQEHMKSYGPWAVVLAEKGAIVFVDDDAGGKELGRIETPGT